ncbi:MAG: hypothetical protein DRG71_03960 [Deltaproteobacteria bacterium]|nr:MAG: hypothetical protein DRG71_03960 [Deltaproteobacteria bacterium]
MGADTGDDLFIKQLAEGSAPWAIPWPCVHEFLAIVTHPRIYQPPTPLSRALEQVEAWLKSPSLVMLSEGEGYWRELRFIMQKSVRLIIHLAVLTRGMYLFPMAGVSFIER